MPGAVAGTSSQTGIRDRVAHTLDELPPVTFGWATRRWEALPPYARTFVALVDEGFGRLEPAARTELLA